MPQLVLSIEGVEIRRVNLRNNRTTLGRKPHNDIVLPDLVVSGEHCAFILEGLADVTVEDLRSTNGTYLNIIKEMLESEVSDDLKALKARVAKLADLYEAAINKVKEANDQAVHDFLARRLYNMTGDIVMSLLILDDATKAPEMFAKSANVYVRMAEEEVLGHSAYIQNFKAEDLESFKA